MGSKLFIFVLFGTLFQVSLATDGCSASLSTQTPPATDVCVASSTSIQSLLCVITQGERVTIAAFEKALDNIFVGIISEANIILGIIKTFNGLPAYIAILENNAIAALWEGYVTTVDVVVAIAPDPSIRPADLSAEQAKIAAVVNGIFAAIDLCKLPGTTPDQIRAAVQELVVILSDIFRTLFTLIRNCRNYKSAEVSAINDVETKILLNIQILFNAISEGIVILCNVQTSEIAIQNETVLAELALLEKLVRSVFTDVADNKYQLLRIIVLSTQLNSPEIAGHLASIQTAEKNLVVGWNAALQPIALLLSTIYQCPDVAVAVEAIRGGVVEGLKASYYALLNANEILRDANSPAILVDESAVHTSIRTVAAGILDSIVIAVTAEYPACLDEINANGEKAISTLLTLISSLFKITADISNPRIDIAQQIQLTLDLVLSSIENMLRAVLAVIIFIAEHKTADAAITQSYNLLFKVTELVVLAGVQRDVSLKFGLFRSLLVRKSLCVNGISLDFCIDNDLNIV